MSPGGGGGGGGGGRGRKHNHPGGSASVLGVNLLRFSGAQGISLGVTNLLHYGSIIAVGAILGVAGLGKFSLLLFLTNLVAQIIHVLTKTGTIRRTFGVGDEEDEVEDDDDETEPTDVSDRPPWTLGVGIVFCLILTALFIAVGTIFQRPIADLLLGDPSQGRMVMWASITAGMLATFRLTEMVLWFERRPTAFVLVDLSRPLFNLAAIITLCASGMGVEGAVLGSAIGTSLALVICMVVLRGSYELAFAPREILEILKISRIRFPIVTSMWVIQNADVFILSRYVDHSDLGVYNLASRTGFVVSFLPQGFRVALRPLRKSAAYRAFRREYGQAVAQGQLLAYFVLLCLTAVLAMFLVGEAIVNDATGKFADAADLIPLSAAAMVMPALYRTVSGMAAYPNKRATFIVSTIFAAIVFIGLSLLIVPDIGIYGPPVAMLVGFTIPTVYMFGRSQLGSEPIDFPYLATIRAALVAVALGGFFLFFHPNGRWPQLAMIIVLMVVWFAGLFVLRIVPRHHHAPIAHMARSVFRGSAMHFRARVGIRTLNDSQRAVLRRAVVRMAPAEIEPDADKVMRAIRKAGRQGDAPIGPPTEQDPAIALFLFSNEPVASRQARMRKLLSDGVDANELRTLEDLRDRLAKAPPDAWEGVLASERPRRGRFRPRLRRA